MYRIDLEGDGGELLLSQRGEPLKALQHIVSTAFRRQLGEERRVLVDCQHFRRDKDSELQQMAKFLADKAVRTGGAAGDWPAERVRAPHRASRRGRRRRQLGERRRRRGQDGHHQPEVAHARPLPMFSTTDTIAAIATAAGRGGIGVVRISGPDAHGVGVQPARAGPRRSRRAMPPSRDCASDAVAPASAITSWRRSFPAPHSYTTEDTVEISAHGSPVVLASILDACVRHGARLAAPGEFTFRAYVHGRIELTQAEAVADLVEAVTPLQARTAFDQLEGSLATAICGLSETLLDLTARLEASLDFPDEGYHFIDPGGDPARGRTPARATCATCSRAPTRGASSARGVAS